jgi:hypothetical protein
VPGWLTLRRGDPLDDPAQVGGGHAGLLGHEDQEGRPRRDQHAGAAAGRLARPLALPPQQAAQRRRQEQAHDHAFGSGWTAWQPCSGVPAGPGSSCPSRAGMPSCARSGAWAVQPAPGPLPALDGGGRPARLRPAPRPEGRSGRAPPTRAGRPGKGPGRPAGAFGSRGRGRASSRTSGPQRPSWGFYGRAGGPGPALWRSRSRVAVGEKIQISVQAYDALKAGVTDTRYQWF